MEAPNSIYDIYNERVRRTLTRLGGTASIACFGRGNDSTRRRLGAGF